MGTMSLKGERLILSVLYVTCASVVGAGTPSVSTQGKKINNGGDIKKIHGLCVGFFVNS